ncbi:Hypothetical predicted protein [Mytilus galloprovincialis]|uniref:Uncharacterized protein n=1 Tax=Mytilus galloprovincialis TaxID=29158 RepID=A0A8B6HAY5_MYTGA|nr:Hypothetical predicted protein [Mytilus galloprovincialis]
MFSRIFGPSKPRPEKREESPERPSTPPTPRIVDHSPDPHVLNDFLYYVEGHGIVVLGQGIRLRTEPELSAPFKCFKVENWTSKERDDYLNDVSLPNHITLVSDIYRLLGQPDAPGLEELTDPSESKRFKEKQCVFSVRDKYKKKVYLQVPVYHSFVKDSDINDYWALIEDAENRWKEVPAYVKIQRPIGKLENKDVYSKTLVEAVSHKITLDFNKTQLKGSISVSARLTSDPKSSQELVGSDNPHVKMIVFNKSEIVVLPTGKKTDTKEYTGQIRDSDGVLFARIKPNQLDHKKLTTILTDELEAFYGTRMLCTVLVFFLKKTDKTIYFIAECCLKQRVDSVLLEHQEQKNSLAYRSGDLFLPSHQRIRIRPEGSLKLKKGDGRHPFLYFMYTARDNFTSFSVEFVGRLGIAMNAVLEFSADNHRRGNITRADFDISNLLLSRYLEPNKK